MQVSEPSVLTFVIDGRAPVRPDPSIAELADLLHDRLIGELRIESDADATDWRTLLLLLSRTAEELMADGGIAKLWAASGQSHFDIREIDYAEVLRERGGGDAAAWERIATFQGRASLATWLHRIAYTKFVDAQRARRRAAGAHERLARPAVSSDPFAAVLADDEARRLDRALHRLDAPERSLLVLHYFQGLSYREMAAVLDQPRPRPRHRR